MKDTKIYSAHRELLYTVETDIVSNSHIFVYPADTQEKVASVKKRDIIPDVIAYGGESLKRLSKWLCGKNGHWSDLLSDPPSWLFDTH